MADITKTDDEWRAQLSPEAFRVTREHGTEPAHSNDNFPKDAGTFSCVGCGEPLFEQSTKFDSGTGWPSFFQPISPESVGETNDRRWLMSRTKVHCAKCDAHLGHVFSDGPKPTGQRYCMNGVALDFKAD